MHTQQPPEGGRRSATSWWSEIETIFYRRCDVEQQTRWRIPEKMKTQRNGNIEKCTLRKSDEGEKKARWYWRREEDWYKSRERIFCENCEIKNCCVNRAMNASPCTGDWKFSFARVAEKWMDRDGRRKSSEWWMFLIEASFTREIKRRGSEEKEYLYSSYYFGDPPSI